MSTLQEFKCPCCNGSISFDTKLQKMKCPYCDTEFSLETLQQYDSVKIEEEDQFEWDAKPGQEWAENETDGLLTYVCNSCGGEIVADENMAGGRTRRRALLCVQVLRRRDRRRCQPGSYSLSFLRQSRGDDGSVLGCSQAGSCHSVQAG